MGRELVFWQMVVISPPYGDATASQASADIAFRHAYNTRLDYGLCDHDVFNGYATYELPFGLFQFLQLNGEACGLALGRSENDVKGFDVGASIGKRQDQIVGAIGNRDQA